MSREIRKKLSREYFEEIMRGQKTYEFRVADFECEPGDILILDEYEYENDDSTKERVATGRSMTKRVGQIGRTKDFAWTRRPDVAADAEKYGYQIISLLPESRHDLFEVSCKVILLNKDKTKVVLVDYENGVSSLPGGHLERGETLEGAARREVKEELGIDYMEKLEKGSFIFLEHGERLVVAFAGELDEGVELPEVNDPDGISIGGRWYEVDEVVTGATNISEEYQELVGKIIGRTK